MFELKLKNDYSERIRYNVPNMPIYICKSKVKTIAGTSVECHWHDEVEFILMISGKLRYNINGGRIALEAGYVLFVNSKQMHFGFATKDSTCDYICVLLNAKLRP